MNYFGLVAAYASPLVLGLIFAFLSVNSVWAGQHVPGALKIIFYYAAVPAAGLMVLMGIDLLSSPDSFNSDYFSLSFGGLAGLGVFLWSWLLAVSGLGCLLSSLGLGRRLSYLLVAVLILLTNTTAFYINPVINAWQGDFLARQWVIKAGIAVNPMLALASNFFRHDLLRAREMYALCDIGPYYFYGYPDWTALWAWYLGLGLAAFAAVAFRPARDLRPDGGI